MILLISFPGSGLGTPAGRLCLPLEFDLVVEVVRAGARRRGIPRLEPGNEGDMLEFTVY